MKKFVYLFFIFIFSVCMFGCKNNVDTNIIRVENVVINKSHAYVNVGESIVLLAQVFPFNAINQKIIWQSDNNNIAVVDSGVVFGKQEGKTVITATSEDGNFCDRCTIFVSTPKLTSNTFNNISSVYDVNSYINPVELWKTFKQKFDDEMEKIEFEFENFKTNQNNFKNINSTTNDNSQNQSQFLEDYKNNDDSTQKSYYFEYKYNSNGIDDEEDEFTKYKDDKTIIKEILF